MKEKNKIFFGDHGITATSANYLANIAKEEVVQDREELDEANFITETIRKVSSGVAPDIAREGKDDVYVAGIPKLIQHIAAMDSFCAWIREAIKAKEDEVNYWSSYTVQDYADSIGETVPMYVQKEHVTEDDIIAEMNVKEREEYLALNSTAAAFGQYIHPLGKLNIARKALHKGLANPSKLVDRVSDTYVFSNQASAKPELVDSVFDSLQNSHRTYEQRLNSIKSRIKDEVTRRNQEIDAENAEEIRRVIVQTEELNIRFREYVRGKLAETQKLKIVIPEKLKPVYEYLNLKGKDEQ